MTLAFSSADFGSRLEQFPRYKPLVRVWAGTWGVGGGQAVSGLRLMVLAGSGTQRGAIGAFSANHLTRLAGVAMHQLTVGNKFVPIPASEEPEIPPGTRYQLNSLHCREHFRVELAATGQTGDQFRDMATLSLCPSLMPKRIQFCLDGKLKLL